MKEQLITNETSELAFNVGCEIIPTTISRGKYVSIPQSLLQRWLREAHKIHLVVWWSDNDGRFYCELERLTHHSTIVPSGDGTKLHESYEQALEAGLQQALKLIKQIENGK